MEYEFLRHTLYRPWGRVNSGDIVHHVQQHFQFRFQLRHDSLLPYQKLQARQLRQLEQNILALPVLIYTFMELLAGISLAAIEQWGKTISGNNVKTKFPIAFTAFCMLSVSVNSSNGNAAESVFRNGFGYTNKTLSDWILRGPTGDATYFADYIAIGC